MNGTPDGEKCIWCKNLEEEVGEIVVLEQFMSQLWGEMHPV